jgi:hypothetical protein
MMLSSLKRFATQGLAKNVKATGAGSANPVVSMMMASIFFARPLDRLSISANALTMSFLKLQQTHLWTAEQHKLTKTPLAWQQANSPILQ